MRETEEQRTQGNSHFRLQNLKRAFATQIPPEMHGPPVLLVDDLVDSKWTLTVVAALLRKAGSGPVYPFALAVTTGG